MSVVFTPHDVAAVERRDYWYGVLRSSLWAADYRGGSDGSALPDRLELGRLGALHVNVVSARAPGGADRGARHVRADGADRCALDLVLDGHGTVAQDGREATLRSGDIALVDMARPARWRFSANLRLAALVFPRRLLPSRQQATERVTAVTVDGQRGVGALASSLTRTLVGNLAECETGPGTRLGASVLDLLATALADVGAAPAPEAERRTLVTHPGVRRGAPRRPHARPAHHRRRPPRLDAVPVQAVRGRGPDRRGLGATAAAGTLPPRPARPGVRRAADPHDRGALGDPRPEPVQPPLPRRLRHGPADLPRRLHR